MLLVASWAILFLLALACPASAVVPALLAPLAALLAIFPQIWLLCLGALSPFIKRKGWLAVLGLLGFAFWWVMTRETRAPVVAPTPTSLPVSTSSWKAFRGQPDGRARLFSARGLGRSARHALVPLRRSRQSIPQFARAV
jgi:hypothetical protein